jgi:HlyD family secretion protein
MSKTVKWILGLSVLLVSTIAALKAGGVIGKSKLTQVAIDTVGTRTIVESVSASGKLYPVAEVKVSPDISGEILELFVAEGQRVQKGQLLARIDASLYQNSVTRANAMVQQSKSGTASAIAQVKQLEMQMQQAKISYDRSAKLYKDNVISAAEFETAEAAYKNVMASIATSKENINSTRYNTESAVAGLAEANQNIKRTNLYAPSSGIISRLNVKQGERVVGTAQMAGTEMLRIADMTLMKVDVEIGENDIQKINIGDTAIIEVDAYTKRKFKGFVSKIAQSNTASLAAQASGSSDQVANYTVSIEVDAASYQDLVSPTKFPFRPGMSASVEILTKHKVGIIAVPINAVTTRDVDSNNKAEDASDDYKEYVFVLGADKKVSLREVATDVQDNTYIEITKGLKQGEKVITAPYSAIATKLKDKQQVEVVAKDQLFEVDKSESISSD